MERPKTASGSTLRLQRLPLELSPRLPAVVPESPPTAWNILDPAYLTAIAYGQNEKNLTCEVTGTRFVVAEGIEEFGASTFLQGAIRSFSGCLSARERFDWSPG